MLGDGKISVCGKDSPISGHFRLDFGRETGKISAVRQISGQ
jgi:hypothetical protein